MRLATLGKRRVFRLVLRSYSWGETSVKRQCLERQVAMPHQLSERAAAGLHDPSRRTRITLTMNFVFLVAGEIALDPLSSLRLCLEPIPYASLTCPQCGEVAYVTFRRHCACWAAQGAEMTWGKGHEGDTGSGLLSLNFTKSCAGCGPGAWAGSYSKA